MAVNCRFSQRAGHDYLAIDRAAVWSVNERYLPELASAVERMTAIAAEPED